jgi:hypothetical protein
VHGYNDSETWAKFIYQDIICRFGCIPSFQIDGGPEFKGAAEILLKQYGIVVVMTTPYTPRNNAVVEQAHPTLYESLFCACGTDVSRWPLYLHACLLAMRCTTSRMTGFAPYYLLYGRSLLLAFDISDQTWDTLDWHVACTTADLIALRAQQIVRWDRKLVLALEQQKQLCQKAVDQFNLKWANMLSTGDFELGTWVLAHETWLDTQVGNKGALRWSGPFIIHEKACEKVYHLRELDGTMKRELFFADRLKIFYYREDHQTVQSLTLASLDYQYPYLDWNVNSRYVTCPIYQSNETFLQTHIIAIEAVSALETQVDMASSDEQADICTMVANTSECHNLQDLVEWAEDFYPIC